MKAIRLYLWMSMILGGVYPLLIWAIAQAFMPDLANGSMIGKSGSRLIGQRFKRTDYFWSRPSSVDYNLLPSGASNFGPINPQFLKQIEKRRAVLSKGSKAPIPADLLFASASGLDPHVSPEGALFQAERVAKSRKVSVKMVQDLVKRHTSHTLFGKPTVNVLELNIELDKACGRVKTRP